MVAIQDITHAWHTGAPLCQGCGHELSQDGIGTVCELCIAEEVAGRPGGRREKSAIDMVWQDLMDTDDPAEYWYWLDIEDTMLAKPGEPTNMERNVTTCHAITWAERYEEDRRKLNELYDRVGIERDTPIALVMGVTSGIARAGR